MEEIINTYEVPGLGRVELIHDKGAQFSSNSYFAKIKGQENGLSFIYTTCNSTSEEELKINTIDTIRRILETTKSELEKQLNPIISSLDKISSCSANSQALDKFKSKCKKKN